MRKPVQGALQEAEKGVTGAWVTMPQRGLNQGGLVRGDLVTKGGRPSNEHCRQPRREGQGPPEEAQGSGDDWFCTGESSTLGNEEVSLPNELREKVSKSRRCWGSWCDQREESQRRPEGDG